MNGMHSSNQSCRRWQDVVLAACGEAGFWHSLSARAHILVCRRCRDISVETSQVTNVLTNRFNSVPAKAMPKAVVSRGLVVAFCMALGALAMSAAIRYAYARMDAGAAWHEDTCATQSTSPPVRPEVDCETNPPSKKRPILN